MRTYRFLRGLCFGLALMGVVWAAHKELTTPKELAEYYGKPLDVPTDITTVQLRYGCRQAAFGTAPWRGEGEPKDAKWELATREALTVMGLPVEAVDKAMAKLKSESIDSFVQMGNTHGTRAFDGKLFYPVYTTTYKVGEQYYVCRGSATQFMVPTRKEPATLHRIQYAGQTYWIGEFVACGNVAMFFEAPAGWAPFAPPPGASGIVPWQTPEPPYTAPPPGMGGYLPGPGYIPQPPTGVVRDVPEPESLLLVLLGLAGIYFWRKK